jgi:hypothetical protein
VQKHSVINSQAPLTAKVGLFPKVSITGAGQVSAGRCWKLRKQDILNDLPNL